MEEYNHTIDLEKPSELKIKIITAPKDIIPSEKRRVVFYFKNYSTYVAKGYKDILTFPKLINPESTTPEEDLEKIIKDEFSQNMEIYDRFASEFQKVFDQSKVCIPIAENMYGCSVKGDYSIMPTAYGTWGSSGDPIYIRIPHFNPPETNEFSTGKFPTLTETIVHEIFAHKATQLARLGTSIDDSIHCSHQQHKERLMDLITKKLLIEANLLPEANIAMQTRASEVASNDIDIIFSESNWYGNINTLVSMIDKRIKRLQEKENKNFS